MGKNLGMFIFIVLMLIVVGCSNENVDGNVSDENNEMNNEAQEIDSNNGITIAIDQNFITLDPHDAGDTVSIYGIRSMYEGLVGFDENMDIIPVLAEDYEISEDALEYVFTLKEDIVFHDGEPFNADAVKSNFERVIDEELRAARNLQYLDSIEVLSDYEIKFTLTQPFGAMINKFAMIPIASPKAFMDAENNFALNPVGTGRFMFGVWNQGDSLTVTKFDDYWGEGETNVDKVTFRPVPENGARTAMLKTGEADFVYPVPQNNVNEFQETEDIIIEETPSTIARYVSINTFKEPFNDERVRQAMNYAVDKEAFLAVVKNGYGNVLDSTMSSETQYYSKQDPYTFDLEKAKGLMAEAGYENGFEAEIWGNTSSETSTGMQFIKQQLAQIGIDVEIKSMEEGTLSDEIYTPATPEEAKVQMWYVSWSPSSGDADGATRSLFHNEYFPPNGANTAYYNNSEVSNWIDAANNTADQNEQKDIYSKIQSTVFADAPWIFLGTDTILSGHKKELEGIYVLPDGSISITNANIK
ncbi:glutathione ABC transporter substrate-binding protein (plasmid) [Alkalihalophilus pseudofirmus]|uniref:glutathione ABC transporter substrate-binding protein n=1 Tax=Alkalihalophilus pseudofirmus TaxID=79885 RepID=UPI00259B480E|nr:glutathione ABC transporter substrate-binding protein [Alkalihalophilus pseudofirmus]WEG19217.1 glutathione ABC transporter substrate-binding protein [Alkalihalophilus pseudofirmus]